MSEKPTWSPTCPGCGRSTSGLEVTAEGRREAQTELRGTQGTCPTCGTTFTVDHRTVLREA